MQYFILFIALLIIKNQNCHFHCICLKTGAKNWIIYSKTLHYAALLLHAGLEEWYEYFKIFAGSFNISARDNLLAWKSIRRKLLSEVVQQSSSANTSPKSTSVAWERYNEYLISWKDIFYNFLQDEDVDRQEAEDIEGIWRSDARRKGTKLKYIDLKKEIHFPDYEQKQSRGFRAFNTDLLGPPLVVENDYSNHDANFPDDSEEDTNKS